LFSNPSVVGTCLFDLDLDRRVLNDRVEQLEDDNLNTHMDIGSLTRDLQEVRQQSIATEEKLDSFMKDFKHFVQEHFHPLQSALSCKRCHCYSDSNSSLPSPISPIRPNSESGGPARSVLIRFSPNLVGYDISSPTLSGSRDSSSFITIPSLISVSSSGEDEEGREEIVN